LIKARHVRDVTDCNRIEKGWTIVSRGLRRRDIKGVPYGDMGLGVASHRSVMGKIHKERKHDHTLGSSEMEAEVETIFPFNRPPKRPTTTLKNNSFVRHKKKKEKHGG